MNRQWHLFLKIVVIGLLALTPVMAMPQGDDGAFEDPGGNYALKLPKDWLAVVNKDGLGHEELDVIVYRGVRENGALKIRRLTVESGTKAMDAAKRDEDQSLRFQPGYVRGGIENFASGYNSAALVSYDYTQAGRPKTGRAYYILVNETTVYSLRFSGNRNSLAPLRAQTDAIARSFKGK